MSRQKQLLAVLGVVFVLALGYAFWASPRPREVATTVEAPQPRRPVAERPADASARETLVRLDLLTRDGERFAGYKRDLFNYPRVAPPPPPQIVKPPVTAPPPSIEFTEPAPVSPEVERELARFTFLGFLEKERMKTVFLSSEGETFLVKKGETFGEENEFQVTNLTPEMLVIRHSEDPRAITIPLVEQAPLAPSESSRSIQPFSRSQTGSGSSYDQGGEPERPGQAPVEEGEDFPPYPAEEENGFPTTEESSEAPPLGEEGETENDMSPPGGAANE